MVQDRNEYRVYARSGCQTGRLPLVGGGGAERRRGHRIGYNPPTPATQSNLACMTPGVFFMSRQSEQARAAVRRGVRRYARLRIRASCVQDDVFPGRVRTAVRPYGLRAVPASVVALFVLLGTLISAPYVTAQETNHPCLTVATPEQTAEPTATPAQPPVPSPVGGSPVASPDGGGATPVSFPSPTVDPGAVIAPEIAAVQSAIAACASAGDYSGMSTLVSTRYLDQAYSAGEPLSRRAFIDEIAPLLPVNPVRVVAIDNVQPAGNSATAEVTLVVGNQLLRLDSTFVQQGSGDDRRWLLDSATEAQAPRPEGADIVHIRIQDGRYRLAEDTAKSPEVVLKGTNEGEATHEMLVVRLEPGTTTDALLVSPGPQFPRGITFVGQVTIEPGATDELVLVDLTPGRYAIVCLLYDEDGNPYLASGMRARLEVT
jgi:hypothetical protein